MTAGSDIVQQGGSAEDSPNRVLPQQNATLRVVKAPQAGLGSDLAGESFSLGSGSFTIGRSPDCAIRLNGRGISREHARVTKVGDDFFIEDLGSRNGTIVGDEAIQGRHKLAPNDLVRILAIELEFDIRQPSVEELEAQILDVDQTGGPPKISSRLTVLAGGEGAGASVDPEDKLKAVLQINKALGGKIDVDSVFRALFENVFDILPMADRGLIVMRDEKTGRLYPRDSKHRSDRDQEKLSFSRTIVNDVLDNGEAILSHDVKGDERFQDAESLVSFEYRSMMCAPLLDSQNKAVGVVQIDSRKTGISFSDSGSGPSYAFDNSDLELLASVACIAAAAFENSLLAEDRTRLALEDRDKQNTAIIQAKLLPDGAPEIDGYDFFSYYHAARVIGGDGFDYVPLSDGRWVITLTDVSGKGIAGAFLMGTYRTRAQEVIPNLPIIEAVQQLNLFCNHVSWDDRFVTGLFFVLDPSSHQVEVVNAGHMAPLLKRADGSLATLLDKPADLPLGVTEDLGYESFSLTLEPGEILVAYTDGFPDASNPRDEMLGEERFQEMIGNLAAPNVQVFGEGAVTYLEKWIGSQSQTDDMCMTAFGRT